MKTLPHTRLLCLLVSAIAAGCGDPSRAGAPHEGRPGNVGSAISDGANQGNIHFFFLPPMLSQPTYSGVSDGTLAPTVQVCDLGVATPVAGSLCVGTPVASFTTTSGTGSEVLRYNATDEHYHVNWHTDLSNPALQTGHFYRVSVSVGGTTVGFADVAPVSGNSQLKNSKTGDIIGLVNGRTLPVKFRIEQGMAVKIAVTPDPLRVIAGKTGTLTAVVLDAHDNPLTDHSIAWTTADPAVATVNAAGGVTGIAVGTTSVTASTSGISASATVVVIPPPVASIAVAPSTSAIRVGESVQLTATLRDADGTVLTGRVVDWSSSNGAIATVSGAGLTAAVAPTSGTPVTITATSEGKVGTAVVTIASAGFTLAVGSVSAGAYLTCGLSESGEGYCWGLDDQGQLGHGVITGQTSRPLAVAGNLRFVQISAGSNYSCALTADGVAYCWGWNNVGQLGDGTFNPHAAPAPVLTSLRFTALSTGGATCGLATNGAAYCWGWNSDGRLGAGNIPSQTTPVAVLGGRTYTSIAAGPNNTCAVTAAGVAKCWGVGGAGVNGVSDGLLGIVAEGYVFHSITVGLFHACALVGNGSAYCWGSNQFGQIGDGPTANNSTPVPAAIGFTFVSLAASATHTCGLRSNGDVYCWGANTFGQLGTGNNAPSNTPVLVSGSVHFASLVVGMYRHTCGVAIDKSVHCWGYNYHGTLGDGTGTDRNVPTRVIQP